MFSCPEFLESLLRIDIFDEIKNTAIAYFDKENQIFDPSETYIILDTNQKLVDSLNGFFSPNEPINYFVQNLNQNHLVQIKRKFIELPSLLVLQIKRVKLNEQNQQFIDAIDKNRRHSFQQSYVHSTF